MIDAVKKFDLQQGDNKLKLYFFTVQGGAIQIETPEDFKAIIAYTDNDAVSAVRREYPTGTPIYIKKRAHLDMEKVVEIIMFPSEHGKVIDVAKPLEEVERKDPMDFIYSLMLVADRFVTDEKDRKTLKKIISKINLNGTTPSVNA